MADDKKPEGGETPAEGAPKDEQPKDGVKPNGEALSADERKALNEEAKKHRLEAKAAKDELARYKRALAIATGKEEEQPDPSALEKQKAETKARNLLLRAEFTSVAAKEGVVDATRAFKAFADELADVPVDVEKETVDRAALAEKVKALKKSDPYFFGVGGNPGAPTKSQPVDPPPDRGGMPTQGAKGKYEQWKQMLAEAGNSPSKLAQVGAFYAQNQKDIEPFIAKGG